jgi:nuclear protein localization family protein 4
VYQHLLVFLAGLDVVPLRVELSPLLQAVRSKDDAAAAAWQASDAWSTVERLIMMASSNGLGGAGSSGSGAAAGAASWTCVQCTFINAAG